MIRCLFPQTSVGNYNNFAKQISFNIFIVKNYGFKKNVKQNVKLYPNYTPDGNTAQIRHEPGVYHSQNKH